MIGRAFRIGKFSVSGNLMKALASGSRCWMERAVAEPTKRRVDVFMARSRERS